MQYLQKTQIVNFGSYPYIIQLLLGRISWFSSQFYFLGKHPSKYYDASWLLVEPLISNSVCVQGCSISYWIPPMSNLPRIVLFQGVGVILWRRKHFSSWLPPFYFWPKLPLRKPLTAIRKSKRGQSSTRLINWRTEVSFALRQRQTGICWLVCDHQRFQEVYTQRPELRRDTCWISNGGWFCGSLVTFKTAHQNHAGQEV